MPTKIILAHLLAQRVLLEIMLSPRCSAQLFHKGIGHLFSPAPGTSQTQQELFREQYEEPLPFNTA